MSCAADGFAQITNEVALQGNGVEIARQFRDGVLHPVLNSLNKDQGGREVVAFLSCLLLQCALDLRALCGEPVTQAAIDEVREQLGKTAAKASH